MLEIDWKQAAVTAALLAGVFTLTKEFLTFGLNRVSSTLDETRKRHKLMLRLATYHAFCGRGSARSLENWTHRIDELRRIGQLSSPEQPSLVFLDDYVDHDLGKNVVELLSNNPGAVEDYIQSVQLKQSLARAADTEKKKFDEAPFYFSYPHTRRRLYRFLKHEIESLERIIVMLPESYIDLPGPRTVFQSQCTSLKSKLAAFDNVSLDDITKESYSASAQMQSSIPRRAVSP
jgi:hypothetical protein